MVTSGKQLHMQVHTTSSDLDVAELFLLQNPAWEEQGSVGYIPHSYVPGGTQGQAGLGSEQPDVAAGVPVHCRADGAGDL